MTEGLIHRITSAKKSESLRDIFYSLNLGNGYDLLNEKDFGFELSILDGFLYLKDKNDFFDKIIRYVAYAYSYDSTLFRRSKDRDENKSHIAKHVGLETTQPLIQELLKNEIPCVNEYIMWWLKETQDPLIARYLSGLDLESEKLKIVREGLRLSFKANDLKEMDVFVKMITKDSKLKTQAFFDAVKIREQADKDYTEYQRKYEALENIVKKEVPNAFDGKGNIAEWLANQNEKKAKQKSSNSIAIEQ